MAGNPRVVACPHCGKPAAWNSGNAFRPFCSERCKMIDLGAWATESYRIPAVENDEGEELSEPGVERPTDTKD